MLYHIFPLKGVGDVVKFGMKRDEVRGVMNGKFETFTRGSEWGSGIPVDFYTDDGVFFYYDREDCLNAVEFSRGSEAVLGEISIFNGRARDVIRYMSEIDREVSIESDGATSRKLSLGLWAPDLDEDPDASVESFLAGKLGYYDGVF